MTLYEGCLIKLRGREEIFYIKGLVEESGRYIALPRYVPSERGDRIDLRGRRYVVLKTFDEQIEYLKRKAPELFRLSKIFGTYLPLISEEDIDEAYHPDTKLRDILRRPIYEIDETISKLVKELTREIPINLIGVTGSRLVDLTGPGQDIDLLILDYRYVRNVIRILSKIREDREDIITKFVEYHRKNLRFPKHVLKRILERRVLENVFRGYPYFVRILLMRNYEKCIIYRRVRSISRVVTYGKIIESNDLSYTTPCIHKVRTSINVNYLISDKGVFTDTLVICDAFRILGRLEVGELYVQDVGIIRRWIYLDSSSVISLP